MAVAGEKRQSVVLAGAPSPIEVSSRLTRVVERHVVGEATSIDLDEACRHSMAELDGLRQDFFAAYLAEPAPFRNSLRLEVAAVQTAFEDFRHLLQSCRPGAD